MATKSTKPLTVLGPSWSNTLSPCTLRSRLEKGGGKRKGEGGRGRDMDGKGEGRNERRDIQFDGRVASHLEFLGEFCMTMSQNEKERRSNKRSLSVSLPIPPNPLSSPSIPCSVAASNFATLKRFFFFASVASCFHVGISCLQCPHQGA